MATPTVTLPQATVAPAYTNAAPYSTLVTAPTTLHGPQSTGIVAPTTVFAPYSAIVPANTTGASGFTTAASVLQTPSPFVGGTFGTLAGSTVAPTRAAPEQTLPLQAKTLAKITDAGKAANLIPSYAGELGVGNYNASILPITHTIHNILPPAIVDPNVVHCNPTPSGVYTLDPFKMTHDSLAPKKREKRAKKFAKKPETATLPENRILPFGVPFANYYRETEWLPFWYNGANFSAGPGAPYVSKLLI